jgi:HEAT repeat protein
MRRFLLLMVGLVVAMSLIAATPVERAAKTLKKSRRAADRIEAIETLEQFEQPESVAAIVTALQDSHPEVRRAAASALWGMSESVARAAIPALRESLNDDNAGVVIRAAGALDYLGIDDAELLDARIRALPNATRSNDRFLAARELIGHHSGDQVAPFLLSYAIEQGLKLDDPNNRSRTADGNLDLAESALIRLGKSADRSAIDPMKSAIGQSFHADRIILMALAEFDPPPADWYPLLARHFRGYWHLAVTALDLTASSSASKADIEQWAPAAIAACDHPDENVRIAVSRAFSRGKGLSAIGADCMLRQLQDSVPRVRQNAAEALGDMGNRDQAVNLAIKQRVAELAFEPLRRLAMNDNDGDVRNAAAMAINELEMPPEEIGRFLVAYAVADDHGNNRMLALIRLRNHGADIAGVIEPLKELEARGVAVDLVAAVRESAARGSVSRPLVSSQTASVQQSASGEAGLKKLRELGLDFSESRFVQALAQSDVAAVQAYLDAGFSANHQFSQHDNRSVLYLAVFMGGCVWGQPSPATAGQLVSMLLDRDADPNITDNNGNAPLAAALQCDRKVVQMLIDAGADIYHRNSFDMDAFMGAAWSGTDSLIPLIEAGYRLSSETAVSYREAYKDNPRAVAIIDRATD